MQYVLTCANVQKPCSSCVYVLLQVTWESISVQQVWLILALCNCMIEVRLINCVTVVFCKYAPTFANLALVQNAGGAYTRDATFSLAIIPSLPVQNNLVKQEDLIVGGGTGSWAQDAPNTSGRLTNFNVEGRGSKALSQSSWCVHRWCRQSMFVIDTLTVGNWVT